MKRLLCFLMFLPSSLCAIDTGEYNIGTGQTYTTISGFEAALDATLTGDVTGWINADYNDTTAVTFAGVTTAANARIYIDVKPDYRNTSAVWDGAKASMTVTGDASCIINTGAEFFVIRHMQIHNKGNGSDSGVAISITTNNVGVEISQNLIRGDGATGTFNRGIRIRGGNGNKIHNNIIYGFYNTDCYGIDTDNNVAGIISYVYNNTISTCSRGINDSAANAVIVAKNNVVQITNTNGWASNGGWGSGSDYNVGDAGDDPPGSSSIKSSTVTFVNAASYDFRLDSADMVAKDNGADLSGDANNPFGIDIVGTARPQNSVWDRGAFEIVSAPPASPSTEEFIPQVIIFSKLDLYPRRVRT